MQLNDIATAPRTLLLEQIGRFTTNELRGMVANHEVDLDARLADRSVILTIPGKVEHMNGTPGPAHQLNGSGLLPVKQKPRRAVRGGDALQVAIVTAISKGATSRGDIERATGATRHQATNVLNKLRERRSVFMEGDRRFARYGLTQRDAVAAHQHAIAAAGETPPRRRRAPPGPVAKAAARKLRTPRARRARKGGRAKARASSS